MWQSDFILPEYNVVLTSCNIYLLAIMFSFVNAGKSPFFPGLEEQAALLEDPASHLVDGQVLPQPAPPLSSPSRSSPHSQGSETGERYSRKVFVGGLPPDIDEGMLVEAAIYIWTFFILNSCL